MPLLGFERGLEGSERETKPRVCGRVRSRPRNSGGRKDACNQEEVASVDWSGVGSFTPLGSPASSLQPCG